FLKSELNRQPRDILPPRLCGAAEPVGGGVQRNALGAGVDLAVEKKPAGVTIDADEVRYAEHVHDRADCVLAGAQVGLEVEGVETLMLRVASRRPLMQTLPIHVKRISRIRADAYDRRRRGCRKL